VAIAGPYDEPRVLQRLLKGQKDMKLLPLVYMLETNDRHSGNLSVRGGYRQMKAPSGMLQAGLRL
jgi:hypothetical protein